MYITTYIHICIYLCINLGCTESERAIYIYKIYTYDFVGCTESERASEARIRTTATPAQFWLSLGPVHVAKLRTSQGYTRDRVESCGPERGRTGASRHEAVRARSKACPEVGCDTLPHMTTQYPPPPSTHCTTLHHTAAHSTPLQYTV